MQFWATQCLVESCQLPFLAMISFLFRNPCFLATCSPAAMSEMIAGAPADPLWDATSIFLPEYADVLLADGVCGRMLLVTEDGWFGFSKDQPGLEQLTSGNRDPFVVDVRRVLHGMYPAENALETSLLSVR